MAGRLFLLSLVVLACAAFQLGPGFVAPGPEGQTWWSVTWWIVTPGIAALTCSVASFMSAGQERKAWRDFCAGCAIWGGGTLIWAVYDLPTSSFPGVSDAAYLLTALFFVTGIFHLGLRGRVLTRIQVANLALVLCAVAVACFILLLPSLRGSELSWPGQAVAVLYPIAWFGTAAFGLVLMAVYAPPGNRFTLGVLLLGSLAMAGANLFYCLTLLGTSYRIGLFFDSFWVLCFLLIAWAAAEQIWQIVARSGRTGVPETAPWQHMAEAFVPAAAVAAVAVAGSFTGVLIWGEIFLLFTPAAMTFAGFLGLREHWALTNERRLKAAAAQSREELASVLECTTDNVVVISRDWRLKYVNGRAKKLFSSLPGFTTGADVWELFPEEFNGTFGSRYRTAMETQTEVEFEGFLPALGLWFDVHAYPAPEALTLFFRDVTERRRTHEQLQYLAHHDTLTGLKNRHFFREKVEEALQGSQPERHAALCLDLDHFKEVNDTLGHPAGDTLLVEAAARLRSCVRDADVVARMGGDEFAILQGEISSRGDAEALAERVLAAFKAPMTINDHVVQLGASIGIAISDGPVQNADELLKRADIALYSAKASGRGSYRLFRPEMEEQLKSRQALKTDLSTALAHSELELVYQPLINLATDRVEGFEALLRWRHPERGMVSPAEFIPIAEETGLILPIGEWALEQACHEAAARWPDHISVAVNLSTCEFRSRNLPDRVRNALAATGLRAGRLEIEITESVLLQDSEANLDTLHRLRELGVKIALDDFGTGYSSLAYLRKFPFTKIKIDRSFVMKLDEEGESQAIVRAVTNLGHSLGMAITAEGVETRQQLDHLRAKGCDQVQGYFFSKPVAPEAIPSLIEKLEADRIWWAKDTARQAV